MPFVLYCTFIKTFLIIMMTEVLLLIGLLPKPHFPCVSDYVHIKLKHKEQF